MELRVTEPEARALRETIERDLKHLLLEIARTDNRAMREGLKKREELLRGVLGRLGGEVRMAS